MSQVAYVSNIGEQGQSVSETTAERSPETTQRMAETTEDPLKDFKGFLLVLKSCRATVRPFATAIIDHSVDLSQLLPLVATISFKNLGNIISFPQVGLPLHPDF
jgi:hypothetical protein